MKWTRYAISILPAAVSTSDKVIPSLSTITISPEVLECASKVPKEVSIASAAVPIPVSAVIITEPVEPVTTSTSVSPPSTRAASVTIFIALAVLFVL